MVNRITRDELKAKLDGGEKIYLVEALPEKYFLEKHLPGAINLPHDRIAELAPQLLSDRAAEIVVYCASTTCQNSTLAAEKLMALGYTNVRDYKEGKQDWVDANLPTETNESIMIA
jgi:rhodanese-related sulfurtransferase